MRILSWIAAAVLAAIIVAFAVTNRDMVIIRLWPFAELNMMIFLAVLLPFAVGFVLGWLVAHYHVFKRRRAAKKAEA